MCARRQLVPQFLGQERHHRVQHDEDLVERPAGDGAGFGRDGSIGGVLSGAFGWGRQQRLGQLQIPVAEAVPGKAVDRIGIGIEAIGRDRGFQRPRGRGDFADDPAVDGVLRRRWRLACRAGDAIRLAEARCVPQFGGEVAIAFNALFIELDVAALAFHRGQREAQRVGAELVDQHQRIDGIAL